MTDKQSPAPRGRGRPRKNPPDWTRPAAAPEAEPATPKPKATPDYIEKFGTIGPDWDRSEFASMDENPLTIPRSILDNLASQGIVLEWKTQSVLGKEETRGMNVHRRNGWQEVAPNEIPGIAVTEIEGLRLMARPKALHDKAKEEERKEAVGRIASMRQAHGEGLPIRGGDHVSARTFNHHRTSIEALNIPRDQD